MIKSILSKLWQPRKVDVHSDPTEYLITTKSRQFQGLIVHQNSLVINLRDAKKKRIKILKANILTIAIVGNESQNVDKYHF